MATVGIHFIKAEKMLYDIRPIYLWENEDPRGEDYKLTFTRECSWDTNNEVWSVGDSKKCFHISLTPSGGYLSEDTLMVKIGWLSFRDRYSAKNVDYVARMVTHKEDVDESRPTKYINFIAHEGKLRVEFTPADPLLITALKHVYTVSFQDFLNYFYYSLTNIDTDKLFYYDNQKQFYSQPNIDNKKNTDGRQLPVYKGFWLLWHISRLENVPSWNPPAVGEEDDKTVIGKVAADTVLCCMPCRDKNDASTMRKGNIGKGKGLATGYKGDFPHRVPIRIPMFLGPGTVTISPGDGKIVIYDKNQAEEGADVLPDLKQNTTTVEKTERSISGNETTSYTATVHSILDKFKDVTTWKPEDWSKKGGLISEVAYDDTGKKYYGGQIPANTPLKYKIDEIVIRPEWKAQSSGIKCAIVFVMAYASKNAKFTYGDFITRFTGTKPDRDFVPVPLYDKGLTANNLGDYKEKGAFEFEKNYAYIIDPKTTEKFDSRVIEVTMPGAGNTYEFAALIYRITEKDNDHYKIDQDYNFPIEYWFGIRSVDSNGTQYRIVQSDQNTFVENDPDSPSTGGNTGGNKFDASDTSRNRNYGVQQPATFLCMEASAPPAIRPPPEGSYIKCYLLDLTRHEQIWSNARMSLPSKAGDTYHSDIVFFTGNIPQNSEYQLYIQQYDHFHRPVGRPRKAGAIHKADHTYDIQFLKIVVDESPGSVKVTLSDLMMPGVPSDAEFFYGIEVWIDSYLKVSTLLGGQSKPNKFKHTETFTGLVLPKSAICELRFIVYEDISRTKPLAYYHTLYLTEHFIKSFVVEDIYRGDDKYAGDGTKVKVQFTFEVHTTLPPDDKRYKGRIELHKFPDDDDVEETPLIEFWDLKEIAGDFKATAESPIEIDRGQYVIFIQLIENGENIPREKFYVFWETPGQMASGTIIGGDRAVRLSSPATRPSEVKPEYRIMRDGVLGVVESPWEMRTESMIGGVAVTRPAWIVRPRTVSFRLLVTAPVDDLPDALYALLDVLTSAPKKGLTINLQSSNKLYQLSLNGYIQVGSPKIEAREDRWAIVSVVLDCPHYAWKGRPIVKQLNWVHEVPFPVFGHYPPSVSIWIQPQKSENVQLFINDHKPLIMKADPGAPTYIQVHHDPITQTYSVTGHQSYPPLSPDANDGRDVNLRNYAPHSIRSIFLGDNPKRPYDTENMLKLVEHGSYLPVILLPKIENKIKVVGGTIRGVEYTPYYAFWW